MYVPEEWFLVGDDLKEQRGEREDLRLVVVRRAERNLGRHVSERASHPRERAQAVLVVLAGRVACPEPAEAKVEKHHAARVGKAQIAGLEVSVEHAVARHPAFVAVQQGARHL